MLLRVFLPSVWPGVRGAVLDRSVVQRFFSCAPAQESGQRDNVNKPKSSSTVDPKEVAKFAALSQEWWNPKGPFAGLRALNEARVPFIKEAATRTSNLSGKAGPDALRGLRLLDVGCGGGVLAEALARLGGDVTGVDVTRENIEVATSHMQLDPDLHGRLRYQSIDAEDLIKSHAGKFDVVIASEVIEHVLQPVDFVATLCKLCAPSGVVVITTLNRTPRSYALAIVAAEYVLGMVPKGTHDWNMFVTPQEVALMFQKAGMDMSLLSGMNFNPLTKRWRLTSDNSVNYAAVFVPHAADFVEETPRS